MQRNAPTLDLEFLHFADGCQHVAGLDEVGRGALAGPVAVGIAVVSKQVSAIPEKLTDSKLISKNVREDLIPQISNWVQDHSVGYASASEIDEIGIIGALRLAAKRAINQLTVLPDLIILDGKHNWLHSQPDPDLIKFPVVTKVKADQSCASVAAASVLAKVQRDNLMIQLDRDYPQYGFAKNVGYGSANHMVAIQKHGPSDIHRRSWNLPTPN